MEKSYSESYAAAGVDITAGYRSVELMKQYVARTMNEHCIGGLGGAAAECLGRTYPVPIRFVGIGDEFVNSGTPEELREYYGLTRKEIVSAAAQAWALRRRQQ